jgi:hypothetical protein
MLNHTSRYLRARRFNSKDAWTQFKDTEDLRKETKLDLLFDTIDLQEYESTRRLVRNFLKLVTPSALTHLSIRNGRAAVIDAVSHFTSLKLLN